MARVRVSTTVDADLLERARAVVGSVTDAVLVDEALMALLARRRAEELREAYVAAYTARPIEEPDAWGDLASWGDAVGRA